MNDRIINSDKIPDDTMLEGLSQALYKDARVAWQVVPREGLPLHEWGDEALMLEHAAGSEAAFEELLRRHEKPMLNYMYRMVQNRHIAEELTQDVFVALVKNAPRYEPRAKFKTYLYAIASNLVSKEWGRQKRRHTLFGFSSRRKHKGDEDEVDALEHVRDEKACVLKAFRLGEVSEAINAALKRLPAHQREVFVLHRFQGLSYEEIAEITDAPVGTVKSRICRAEQALRPMLDRFREYI